MFYKIYIFCNIYIYIISTYIYSMYISMFLSMNECKFIKIRIKWNRKKILKMDRNLNEVKVSDRTQNAELTYIHKPQLYKNRLKWTSIYLLMIRLYIYLYININTRLHLQGHTLFAILRTFHNGYDRRLYNCNHL